MNLTDFYILVVDDNIIINKLIRKILETNGYNVISAYSGTECLKQIITRIPELIILDIILPDISGANILKQLKSENVTQNIPVIIISSLEKGDLQNNISDLGADAYFTKPFNEKNLISTIKKLIQKTHKNEN